jgi:hypothetical protein
MAVGRKERAQMAGHNNWTMIKKRKTDPVELDPEHYRVEAEDGRVRVLRMQFGPHETSRMHRHPSSVLICLTDGYLKFTGPLRRTAEIQLQAAQILLLDPVEHCPQNLSEQPFEAFMVELKGVWS